MSLQNRVLPTGDIVAIAQRGMFMGNRGIIHDPATKTLLSRRWSSKAWIICVCEYKGMHREVMARHSWTELFFLDEATALAAGHRPCFFCRRQDAERFRLAWAEGNAVANPRAPDIDAILHAERLEGKTKRTHVVSGDAAGLPDGAMVMADGVFFAIVDGRAKRWTVDGYASETYDVGAFEVLTPPSTLRALAAGYRPVFHESAVCF